MVSRSLGSDRVSLNNIPPWSEPNQLDSWSLPRLEEIAAEVTRGEGRQVPEHIREIYAMDHSGRLDAYSSAKTEFEQALALLPKRVAVKLRDSMEALRYIDWEHTAADILDSYLSHGAKSFIGHDIRHRYNPERDAHAPTFRNMKSASRWLAEQTDLPNLERLLNVQKITMKGRIDGLERKLLGAIREDAVFGDERENGVTPEQRDAVEANPYLSFTEMAPIGGRLEGRVYGQIIYPTPSSIKSGALARILETHPHICQAVEKYRALSPGERGAFPEATLKELTQNLVRALAEERYATYSREVAQLGSIDSAKSFRSFAHLTADLCRDMIAIHPLNDGNGRSIRLECLYDPLNKHGISRPRLSDPNRDILVARSQWRDTVLRGIISTDKVYRDIARRIGLCLPIENSPELIFPNIPRSVGAHEVHHRLARVQKNSAIIPVDGAQFGAYLEVRFERDFSLHRDYGLDALATMDQLRQDFKEFLKETQRFLRSKKGSVDMVRLQLVDADFAMTFGENFAENAERWRYKMARWYTPEILWRGISSLDTVAADSQIEAIFRRPSSITVSNRSAAQLDHNSHSAAIAQIRSEFKDYNRDVVAGAFFRMAQDHADAGELYPQSYGLSTSRKRSLAGSFAMGALVIDDDMIEYKNRQHLVKDRLIVGAFRAYKDVDLVTLRKVAHKFRCAHPRQAEVLAIGGIDPDAVMYVHRLDERGRIQTTWMRNPHDPSEILNVDGDAPQLA